MQVVHSDVYSVCVLISATEIQDFMASWPCSGLVAKPVEFQFDKRNGDLVDCFYHASDTSVFPTAAIGADDDGTAALALCSDAQRFAGLREAD
jgi:hypothetical protein